MKLSTRCDVALSQAETFAAASDFDAFARRLVARGANVQRSRDCPATGSGQAWTITAEVAGRNRDIAAEVTAFATPQGYEVLSKTGGVEAIFTLDLAETGPDRTEMRVALDLRATNLKGRVLLQSLKLAQANLSERFAARVAGFAREIESP